jgi:beta-1,4-mannosyl-glycoprotein beta-1,4-N-acetylglucosaminyltransferase
MVIDCFPFFNELDLLEIRLNELKDVVDVFVLSEATLTFTGKPKRLYYHENQDRFADFADRIHHLVVSDYSGMNTDDSRSMDRQQKQRGLDWMQQEFSPGQRDLVIMSDVDEIPRASVIEKAQEETWWSAAMIEMRLYYYYMNCRAKGRPGSWRNPRLIRPYKGDRIHYNSARKGFSDKDYWDAGWHFSFLHNSVADIQYKVASYTHAPEFDNPSYMRDSHINDCIDQGRDIFRRKRYQFEYVHELDYLPQYVKDNLGRFRKYIRCNGQGP